MGIPREGEQFDCLPKLLAHPGMPYFILLASDPLAPKCVRDWGARRMDLADRETDPVAKQRGMAKGAQAYEVAGAMEAWRLLYTRADEQDDCCIPLPFAEEIAAGWRWLCTDWHGGVVVGIVIGAFCTLATFALWVTR